MWRISDLLCGPALLWLVQTPCGAALFWGPLGLSGAGFSGVSRVRPFGRAFTATATRSNGSQHLTVQGLLPSTYCRIPTCLYFFNDSLCRPPRCNYCVVAAFAPLPT